MDTQIDRPSRMLQWAVDTFGADAMNPLDRAARFLEEAVEVSHALGVPEDVVRKIVERVHLRPQGEVAQEIGAAMITLEVLAKFLGLSADEEAQREAQRVLSKPREHWATRHEAKIIAGTAGFSRQEKAKC